MEFTVNEQGCRALETEILQLMRQITVCVSDIQNSTNMLRNALGEDYDSIGRSVALMANELQQAQQNAGVIASNMDEYIQRVGQARVALQ